MRRAKEGGKRRSRSKSWLAPIGGWVRNQNIARPDPSQPQGAFILQNIFPTATSAELRGGSVKYATLGDASDDVTAFLRYKNGANEKLFAATATDVYDITLISDPDTSPTAALTGLTGGNWSSTQFEATGGIFLIAVNGEDDMRLYDGQWWYPLGAASLYALGYDALTAAFSVGATVTGATSAAHGVIVSIQPATSTTGTLVLKTLSGTFQDNETITGGGGSATANGTQVPIFNGLTGITADKLSYIWSYQNRLFAVEKDTMNFWYAAVDQVGGTLTKFPMAGIFALGGSILFGAAWSLDRGLSGGLSNQCIIVSTEGEVAVFQGLDPGDASWSLVGVYRIGVPLGPDAWIRAGADVVIGTSIGLIPLSQAINRDVAALSPAAVSYPIETEWNASVAERPGDWHAIVWSERQMVLIALPTPSGVAAKMYAANARTGKWCEFTNWDGRCLAVFKGRMFFGSTGGKVVEGYVSGLDQGVPYNGVYLPLFDDLNVPEKMKVAQMVRVTTRGDEKAAVQVSMQYDYQVNLPAPPVAAPITSSSTWGTAVWGEAKWGGSGQKVVQQDWGSSAGMGFAISPAVQITSGSIAKLGTEIVRIDATVEAGDL